MLLSWSGGCSKPDRTITRLCGSLSSTCVGRQFFVPISPGALRNFSELAAILARMHMHATLAEIDLAGTDA
jgi:hypothetical protein